MEDVSMEVMKLNKIYKEFDKIGLVNIKNGKMSERLKEHAWKACIGETLSGVQIPFFPPNV